MRDRLLATDQAAPARGRTLNAESAAALLGTTPDTLRLWEERFGYPVPAADVDGKPRYAAHVVLVLREALDRELSIASAIEEARRGV
jgi:DNA-binding transcriptional MerR regulator